VVSLALTLLRTGPQTRTCTRAQRPGAAADPCPWLHRPAPPPAARVPCACPQNEVRKSLRPGFTTVTARNAAKRY